MEAKAKKTAKQKTAAKRRVEAARREALKNRNRKYVDKYINDIRKLITQINNRLSGKSSSIYTEKYLAKCIDLLDKAADNLYQWY